MYNVFKKRSLILLYQDLKSHWSRTPGSVLRMDTDMTAETEVSLTQISVRFKATELEMSDSM